jgi:TetR/AcrR family transcriptional regulator, transcriptional repressor for nem operon
LYRTLHNANRQSDLTIERENILQRESEVARPREFDEAKALERAIKCFWDRGYEATSMRDLATKMGISSASLYNTYGDKRALFAQSLERYLDHSARTLIKRFEDSLPPKQAIRRFIKEILKHSMNDRERQGCFLVNAALEVAPHDRKLGAFIADRFTEIEAFFYRSIKAAQAEGTIPRNRQAKDLARLLLGVLLAIRVLARSKPERTLIEGVARPALALLD